METVTIFNVLTLPYVVIFHIAMFFVLNEFLYPPKKALTLTVLLNVPILILTFFLYVTLGSERGGQLAVLFYVIPQAIVFFCISKYKDGRFFSTYFFTSGINLFIVQITNLLDYYAPCDNHIVMFLLRLVMYPLFFLWILKVMKPPHLRAMQTIQSGWNMFGCISLLYTLLLLVVFNYPSTLSRRPYDIPAILFVFAMMLLTNLYFIQTLLRQEDYYHEKEINQVLELQMKLMQQKIDQTAQTEKSISIVRHDLRHTLTTLAGMLQNQQTEAAISYIENNIGGIETDASVKWCSHPVLNAMFSAYFTNARQFGIEVDAKLDLPDISDGDAAALSLVFANALENAIQALSALPKQNRILRVKALCYPRLMFSVSNPYDGTIIFDEDGIPTSNKSGHGIGIRSILAWCEKNNATCDFKTADGWFTIRLVRN